MRTILATLILFACASVASATNFGQAFCGGAQQVVLQQNVGHYGVQQFVAPAYAQPVIVQRQFVQRQRFVQPIVVQQRFRRRAFVQPVIVRQRFGVRRAFLGGSQFGLINIGF